MCSSDLPARDGTTLEAFLGVDPRGSRPVITPLAGTLLAIVAACIEIAGLLRRAGIKPQ